MTVADPMHFYLSNRRTHSSMCSWLLRYQAAAADTPRIAHAVQLGSLQSSCFGYNAPENAKRPYSMQYTHRPANPLCCTGEEPSGQQLCSQARPSFLISSKKTKLVDSSETREWGISFNLLHKGTDSNYASVKQCVYC